MINPKYSAVTCLWSIPLSYRTFSRMHLQISQQGIWLYILGNHDFYFFYQLLITECKILFNFVAIIVTADQNKMRQLSGIVTQSASSLNYLIISKIQRHRMELALQHFIHVIKKFSLVQQTTANLEFGCLPTEHVTCDQIDIDDWKQIPAFLIFLFIYTCICYLFK